MRKKRIILLGFLVVGVALWYFYGQSMMRAQQRARLLHACNRQFPLAVWQFFQNETSVPPGSARHSWRVWLLPSIEENELYEKIRLDEPWDSEWNRQFHTQMPIFFRNPCRPWEEGDAGLTTYRRVTGEETFFPADGSRPTGKIVPDPAHTILLVQGAPRCWMDPDDDIPFETAILGVDAAPDGLRSIPFTVRGKKIFIFYRCDAYGAAVVADSLTPSVLRALLTTSDRDDTRPAEYVYWGKP